MPLAAIQSGIYLLSEVCIAVHSGVEQGALVDTDPAASALSSGASAGAAVGNITWSSNAPSGSILTFGLVDDEGGRFLIDGSTGVITYSGSPALAPGEYTVVVAATDGGFFELDGGGFWLNEDGTIRVLEGSTWYGEASITITVT